MLFPVEELVRESCVVLIKKGTAPPLFLFHPIGGGISCYNELVNLLAENIAVYGVQAYAAELQGKITIREIVSIYADHILELRPSGPYRLLGFSYGGAIATEVAQELRSRNGHVDFLAMMDAGPFTTQLQSTPESLWDGFLSTIGMSEEKYKFQSCTDDSERLELLAQLTHKSTAVAHDLRVLHDVFLRHVYAAASHPGILYSEEVVQYMAVARGSEERTAAEREGRQHSLKKFWPNIEVVEVDASHSSIITGEAVKFIACDLNRRLSD